MTGRVKAELFIDERIKGSKGFSGFRRFREIRNFEDSGYQRLWFYGCRRSSMYHVCTLKTQTKPSPIDA